MSAGPGRIGLPIGLDAFEQLASEHEIATIAVQAAQQALLQAQAQRDLVSDRLQRSLFIAPIDGLLVSVDVKPGETVIADLSSDQPRRMGQAE